MTDTQISSTKTNGEAHLKLLEKWVPDNHDETVVHELHSGYFRSLKCVLIPHFTPDFCINLNAAIARQ